MTSVGDRMVALRESPAPASFRAVAPRGKSLGEPRFRWRALESAWLYKVELLDAWGQPVARGWGGLHELPLSWLRDDSGAPPSLEVGATYRWRVSAFEGPPTGEPCAVTHEAEFLYLGP